MSCLWLDGLVIPVVLFDLGGLMTWIHMSDRQQHKEKGKIPGGRMQDSDGTGQDGVGLDGYGHDDMTTRARTHTHTLRFLERDFPLLHIEALASWNRTGSPWSACGLLPCFGFGERDIPFSIQPASFFGGVFVERAIDTLFGYLCHHLRFF